MSRHKALRLAVLSEREFGRTLAKPYSATSKGSIKGAFNVLDQVFKGLPGWIAGHRDNKKTANKGKLVAPYAKGREQLVEDIHACVAISDSRPQGRGSRLAGLSPKDVLEMEIGATGYAARTPKEEVFDLIFSRTEERTVSQASVKIDNRLYHRPCLHRMMPRAKVEVLLALRKGRDYALINLPGRAPDRIALAPTIAYPFRRFGQRPRILLIVDECQRLAPNILETLRNAYDVGQWMRDFDPDAPAHMWAAYGLSTRSRIWRGTMRAAGKSV